ncbi:dihydroorotate dehydrogenase electron transfer subunit [Thalassobacillus hwangdonensis]|uniref:Dihydroorotate dehydrogenase B (NAD(+)), electron transfer subunit n=1 Tax=Thalassobacillus hwangdonensis TaxID=546108 RepID=A0ABW3KXZ2_9BACI
MQREWMTITVHERIAEDTYQMVLKGETAEAEIQPGQFLHIHIGDAFYLRRPISIADVDPVAGTMTILYKVLGDGTEALTKKQPGDRIDVLGPGGNGFPVDNLQIDRALLIGGGIGVPPLYYLARQLKAQGIEVTAVLGFQNKESVFFEEAFSQIGDVHVTTNDGSYGHHGFVTDLLPGLKGTFDTYFSCGPSIMLKAVSTALKDESGYISIEERMGCGIGACFACVVPCAEEDEKGYRKICSDGPVFRPEEVVL